MSESQFLLEARDVHKSFGLNQVLKGITLTLKSSEVVALIGGNGAGKSTLMKILMGIYKPDDGVFKINGQSLDHLNPKKSMKAGIYMVPQEPMIFPHMSVMDNILIGFSGKKSLLIEKLNHFYKQINCKILDEPTSSLTFDEVQTLFKIVRDLKKKGIGIIYITHRLSEVFELADSICIMADGKITLRGETSKFTREMLVEALLPPSFTPAPKNRTELEKKIRKHMPILQLKNFSGYGFKDISFNVLEGEIVGIAGVVGAGRTELANTIFGKEIPLGGSVILDGEDITGRSTSDVIRMGINYVPEDRRCNGLFGISPVCANITSALLDSKITGKVVLNSSEEVRISEKYIKDFRIKVTSPYQEAGSLSGGNQQKVVIARSLSTMPKLVILDEPTRGIDAGARGDVYKIIRELSQTGVAVIVISSDTEEIIELADRAIVFCRGRVSAVLEKDRINQQNITSASFGIYKEEANV